MFPLLLACVLQAHVVIKDYLGPVQYDLCVADFSISGPQVNLILYDFNADGIFKNGFEEL